MDALALSSSLSKERLPPPGFRLMKLLTNCRAQQLIFFLAELRALGDEAMAAALDWRSEINVRHCYYASGTPLMLAVAVNNVEAIRLLLLEGALVDSQDVSGNSALLLACCRGLYLAAECLLDEGGANPDLPNADGRSPLLVAVLGGATDIVDLLLRHGANVNCATPNSGLTVLHAGSRADRVATAEILRALIDAGAEVRVDAFGCWPWVTAAAYGNDRAVMFWRLEGYWLKGGSESAQFCSAMEMLGMRSLRLGLTDLGNSILCFSYDVRQHTLGFESKKENCCLAKPVPGFESIREVCTLDDIQNLLSLDGQAFQDHIRVQSILCSERALGVLQNTSFRARINFASHLTTTGRRHLVPPIIVDTIRSQADLLRAEGKSYRLWFLSLTGVLQLCSIHSSLCFLLPSVLSIAVDALENAVRHERTKQPHAHQLLLVILQLLVLLVSSEGGHEQEATQADRTFLHAISSRLTNIDARGLVGRTALHLACSSTSILLPNMAPGKATDVGMFPSLSVVRLLLRAGMQPNAVDNDRNSALHLNMLDIVQAKHEFPQQLREMELVCGCLLAAGIHVDGRNTCGQSPLSLFLEAKMPDSDRIAALLWQQGPLKLQCLAAQAVRALLPVCGDIPEHLKSFVNSH